MRCPACGSLFPERLPTAPEPERLYDLGPRRRPGWRLLARRLLDLSRRDYVERAVPADARRVLDFGCGSGEYLTRIAAPGRLGFGVDPIEPGGGEGRWRWIEPGEMERHAPFDWITLGHVLEHLDDPTGVLSRLAGLLAPGGGLWIATPNADSFIFRIAQGLARDVDYPRHRTIFARAGLERRLAEAGLAVTWRSPPRVNAVLNVATSTARGPAVVRARAWLALAAHLLAPRRGRDAVSPELIAVCRVRPANPSRVR
jgi:SAM-dependent methyltransferase